MRITPLVLDKIKQEVMNMKNFSNNPRIGTKGKVAATVGCLVAMIALMGTYTVSKFQSNIEDKLAENETQFQNFEVPEVHFTSADEIINEAPVEEEVAVEPTTNTVNVPQFKFSVDSTLKWPVDGGVLMRYSMDQSIYFATLDQYKRNDAMIISAEVGTEVLASEYGIVTIIDDSIETGMTVAVDMGNGYEVLYGQLTDLKISSGSIVEKGQIIGYIAEPSRYYSVEGPNLYYQLLYNEEAIDPLEYLD